MATKVEEAIAEIQAALDEALPIQEGLADYLRVNLKDQAKAEVTTAKRVIDQRVMKLRAALNACTDLLADGYPEIQTRTVEADVLADLRDQQATISAALAKFAPAVATDLGLAVGQPEPKP